MVSSRMNLDGIAGHGECCSGINGSQRLALIRTGILVKEEGMELGYVVVGISGKGSDGLMQSWRACSAGPLGAADAGFLIHFFQPFGLVLIGFG
jgi:hypothetical protein